MSSTVVTVITIAGGFAATIGVLFIIAHFFGYRFLNTKVVRLTQQDGDALRGIRDGMALMLAELTRLRIAATLSPSADQEAPTNTGPTHPIFDFEHELTAP